MLLPHLCPFGGDIVPNEQNIPSQPQLPACHLALCLPCFLSSRPLPMLVQPPGMSFPLPLPEQPAQSLTAPGLCIIPWMLGTLTGFGQEHIGSCLPVLPTVLVM
jgi:hypothetical protein